MKKIELVNSTTYRSILKAGDAVEIGNKFASQFEPHIKLNRWDGECFIKVALSTTKQATLKQKDNKVIWETADKKIHFYPLEPREFVENGRQIKQLARGGFEFETILKSKPTTNKIVLNIESQGLRFNYQPALTKEKFLIPEGGYATETTIYDKDDVVIFFRPENVVGSYSVYHTIKGGGFSNSAEAEKYQCGKAFHIYRPRIVDSDGRGIWGELHIDENVGTLTITIPQEFIDNAVYPISTGSVNFGCESVGSSNATVFNNMKGGRYTATGGTANGNYIAAALANVDAADSLKCALYNSDGSSLIANSMTEERHDDELEDREFRQFDFLSSPTIVNGTYSLVLWSGDSVILCYDSGTSDYLAESIAYTETWPNSIPDGWSEDYSNYDMSIYCNYEGTAPPAGHPHFWAGIIS